MLKLCTCQSIGAVKPRTCQKAVYLGHCAVELLNKTSYNVLHDTFVAVVICLLICLFFCLVGWLFHDAKNSNAITNGYVNNNISVHH